MNLLDEYCCSKKCQQNKRTNKSRWKPLAFLIRFTPLRSKIRTKNEYFQYLESSIFSLNVVKLFRKVYQVCKSILLINDVSWITFQFVAPFTVGVETVKNYNIIYNIIFILYYILYILYIYI